MPPSLPIEVWEKIIDYCAVTTQDDRPRNSKPIIQPNYRRPRSVLQQLGVLCTFALTCKTLFPRSIMHLHHVAVLSGDYKTIVFAKILAKRSRTLKIQIRHLLLTIYYREPDQRHHPKRFHIVPYLLAGPKQNIEALHTLQFDSSESPLASDLIGANTPDIFLRSLATFRSVETLVLTELWINSFRYLVRMILSLQSLRNLHLDGVSISQVINDIPKPLSRRRSPRLRSLRLYRLDLSLLNALDRWATASPSVVRLEFLTLACVHAGLFAPFPNFLRLGGNLLREFQVVGTIAKQTRPMDLSHNLSLQTVVIERFTASWVFPALNTLTSNSLITLSLSSILVCDATELTKLIDILCSSRFTSLSTLERINLDLEIDYGWGEVQVRTPRMRVSVSDARSKLLKLKNVYGERLVYRVY